MSQAAKKLPQGDSEKVQNIARKVMEPFAADLLPRAMTELTELCRSSMQTAIDCIEVTSSMAQEMNEETTQACNRALAEASDISKAAFACRTINDVFELQNRLMKLGMEHCFSESGKLMTKGFDCCTTMLKPLQDHVAHGGDAIAKLFSDKR